MKKIILKKNEEFRILKGHCWVFSNEIFKIEGEPNTGDVVEIYNSKNNFLGSGFYNPHSLISVRLFSKKLKDFDKDLILEKIKNAFELRKLLFPKSNIYRLIYGESDFLPGLIIDRFNNHFSIQTFSAGVDQKINLIVEVLKELFSPISIIERNESQLRQLEGLEERTRFLFGDSSITEIELEGIKYEIDLINGQKTGFFLDQRLNRNSIIPFCNNSEVLDCFCNDGGFALTASKNRASKVTAVDISQNNIERVNKNIILNNLQNIETIVADCFDILKKYIAENKKFDIVILDPPSFTKSKKNIKTALKGYFEINSTALKILKPNGILVSACCSHHIDKKMFLEAINDSAIKTNVTLQQLFFSGPSSDHPELIAMPETNYLKFAIFRVL
ncbi:MAG: class I SAM-dependent rRNA methyltransferase [Bacteroidetes bacterium]|nr:class I SAM-dependent rRNA methyltransferase [Bacteroidota bacterium]